MSQLTSARRALDAGDLEQAEALSSEAIREHASPAALALYGDIVGQLRDRSEAEEWLSIALEQHPRSAHLHAVRGEQRIRQGRWDEGTDDFIEALRLQEGHDDAVAHTHRIVDELLGAVRVRKVAEADATRFVNRLAYSTSGGDELAELFAAARRALAGGTTLAQQGVPSPGPRAESPASSGSAPAPSPALFPPPSPARDRPTRPSSPPASARSGVRKQIQAKSFERSPDSGMESYDHSGFAMAASQARLDALIRQDRALNERLQDSIEHLGAPVWPSMNANRHLDPLPPLRPEGLGLSLDQLRQSSMSLTTGSIDAEILLERCLAVLLIAAQHGTATALTLDPVGLTRLELAMLGGALERLPDTVHRNERYPSRLVALYGLGTFLGSCLVRGYGGTWTFDDDPADSRVTIDTSTFDPFEVARAWLDATDKDEVSLEKLLGRGAQVGSQDARLRTLRVDPSAELTKHALAMKLAEAWAANYTLPRDVPLVEVAGSIRALEVGPRAIVFCVAEQWAPPIARRGGEARLAYLRRTGECLALASRKHFARFVGECFDELDRDSAPQIIELLAAHHRPAVDRVEEPRLVELRGGGRVLSARASGDGQAWQWQLSHEPGEALPWQLSEGEG